jgi:hypothetical protein
MWAVGRLSLLSRGLTVGKPETHAAPEAPETAPLAPTPHPAAAPPAAPPNFLLRIVTGVRGFFRSLFG